MMFESSRWTSGRIAFGAALLVLSGSAFSAAANAQPLAVELAVTTSPVTAPSTVPPTLAATASAAPIAAVGTALNGPIGLAFDAAGNLYVSECWPYAAILRIDPTGTITTFAGTGSPGFAGDGGPAAKAQLYCPLGMAAASDGSLYVADHANNRIRRIDATGIISTVVGSGPVGVDHGSFSGDGGLATAATLQEPYDVALDSSGDLFISDRDNNRIRKVDPSEIISTIAGDGLGGQVSDGGLGTETSLDFPLSLDHGRCGQRHLCRCPPPAHPHDQRGGHHLDRRRDGAQRRQRRRRIGNRSLPGGPGEHGVRRRRKPVITDTVSNTLRRVDPQGIISTLGLEVLGATTSPSIHRATCS